MYKLYCPCNETLRSFAGDGEMDMTVTVTVALLLWSAPSAGSFVVFSDGVRLVVENSNGDVHLENSSHTPQIVLVSSGLSLLCAVQVQSLSPPVGGVLWWVNQTPVFPSHPRTSWTRSRLGLYSAACLWDGALLTHGTHGASYWCGVELHGHVYKQRLCLD